MTRAVLHDERILADKVETAASFTARSRGLLGRASLPAGYALWINPCKAIHMFGMQFAIDAVFLDRKLQVVKVARRVRPGRCCWGGLKAYSVLEMAAGSVPEAWKLTGATVRFEG